MRCFTDSPFERMMMQVPRITDTEPKPPLNLTDIADGFAWLPPLGVSPNLDINVAGDSAFSGTLSLNETLEPVLMGGKPVKGENKNGENVWRFTGSTVTQGTSLFAADYITRSFKAGGLNIDLKYFAKHDKSITDMDAVNVIMALIRVSQVKCLFRLTV